jgi:hypothetical protein
VQPDLLVLLGPVVHQDQLEPEVTTGQQAHLVSKGRLGLMVLQEIMDNRV